MLLLLLLFLLQSMVWISKCDDERELMHKIEDPNFPTDDGFGWAKKNVAAIYRVLGNDLPPQQIQGQERWNMQYSLYKEAKLLVAGRRRWVLNHIWNETEFLSIYSSLMRAGVERRDIVLECFSFQEYEKVGNVSSENKFLYTTAVNQGRNAAILDAIDSGFEWGVVLDGGTFISEDSWVAIRRALDRAQRNNQTYLKIPFHRMHTEQTSDWLNTTVTMTTILEHAPHRGESQIAIHRNAPKHFYEPNLLLEASHSNWGESKLRKEFIKSSFFQPGAVCGSDSTICGCADVIEAHDEFNNGADGVQPISFRNMVHDSKDCGLALKLWSYPSQDLIQTGLTKGEEKGFFCFLQERRVKIRYDLTEKHSSKSISECHVMADALELWSEESTSKRKPYMIKETTTQCKDKYRLEYQSEACFRSYGRREAQNRLFASITALTNEHYQRHDKEGSKTLCQRLKDAERFWPGERRGYLAVFDTQTLYQEKLMYQAALEMKAKVNTSFNNKKGSKSRRRRRLLSTSTPTSTTWKTNSTAGFWSQLNHTASNGSSSNNNNNKTYTNYYYTYYYNNNKEGNGYGILALITAMRTMADKALLTPPATFSVVNKKRNPRSTTGSSKDKRYYYSARPYYWFNDDIPPALKARFDAHDASLFDEYYVGDVNDYYETGILHRDGLRAPGTVIGDSKASNFDRANAWFMVDNVTTLALAWFFTNNITYAQHASNILQAYFLTPSTAMYPDLSYAQQGERTGLIDWKDFYFLLDSVSLLEIAGTFSKDQTIMMQDWANDMVDWLLESVNGRQQIWAANNHGLYFDLIISSLSSYSKRDESLDAARTRLLYRLTKPYPLGHFTLNGSQPYENLRSTALHYTAFNLIGWIHAALLFEAIRTRAEVPHVMQSLFWARHERDGKNPPPVILKGIRWIVQYLPANQSAYERFTASKPGMGVKFPYLQNDEFPFDVLLSIIRYGVSVYGAPAVFLGKPTWKVSDYPLAHRLALTYPLYSTRLATFSKYSSIDPDAGGQRPWPSLGHLRPNQEGGNGGGSHYVYEYVEPKDQ